MNRLPDITKNKLNQEWNKFIDRDKQLNTFVFICVLAVCFEQYSPSGY